MKLVIALVLVASMSTVNACERGCNQTAGSGGYVHIPPK